MYDAGNIKGKSICTSFPRTHVSFSLLCRTTIVLLVLIDTSRSCVHLHGRSSKRETPASDRHRDRKVDGRDGKSTEKDKKNDTDKIKFPKFYHATGLLTLPLDGIMETFEAWYAEEYKTSRVDYYHGLDKTYQRGDWGKYGNFIKEIPIHRSKVGKHEKHGKQCWFKTGKKHNVVKPQSVVPMDLTHYKIVGEEYKAGTLAIKMRRHFNFNDRINNTFTLWVTKSKPHRPIRFETIGFEMVLSGYYDHYYIDYITFTEWKYDPDIMKIPTKSWCHYGAHQSKSNYFVNPMSEFVHHTHEIQKHHNIVEKSYKDFKRKHKKVYKDINEHHKRKNIYRHNARYVRSKNRAKLNYTLALNHLADLTPEEFSLMNDLLDKPDEGMSDSLQDQFPKRGEVPTIPCCTLPEQPLPENLDWREYGIISPIRGQSMCGSCWAFSTAGMLEGAYKIATGRDVQFSAQMLVDCTYGFKNYGCRGGWPWKAMSWVIRNGIATKDTYGRYLAQEGLCHCGPKENCTIIHPTSFGDITLANKAAMKINLAKYGPVSVGINSTPKSFKFYRSGIYDDIKCDNNTEHSLLMVGYGKHNNSQDYWIIKNSWGPYWGTKGYMRIANEDDVCGILTSNGVVANFRNDSDTGFSFERMKKVETPHEGDIEENLKNDGFKPIFEAIPFN